MKQVTYEGLTFEPYITREAINARIAELGKDITRDCAGKMPLFLVVLNGAFAFASDLFRAVEGIDAEISFIRLKSYEGMGSTGGRHRRHGQYHLPSYKGSGSQTAG